MCKPFWALLPYKGNGQSKTRLHLPSGQDLSQQWLATALEQCRQSPLIESTWVVSLGDQFDLPADVGWLRQRQPGLNEGIQEWLDQHRPVRWLVVLPDLPHLSSHDLNNLLRACPTPGIALAPDRHDRGCNGLAVNQAQPQLCFGPDSFPLYQKQGLPSAVVRTHGLAHDVDTLADWESIAWHQV